MPIEKSLDAFTETGTAVFKSLLDPHLLTQVNEILMQEVSVERLERRKLPGFSMGHLAIESCYIHSQLWQELIEVGLIDALVKRFDYVKYLTFGGNANLPNSRRQKLHLDSFSDNIIINVPLVDVTAHNGAVSVVATDCSYETNTFDFFRRKLYLSEKQVFSNLGDVILRSDRVWHRGNPNYSDTPRLMMTFQLRRNWPYGPADEGRKNLISNKTETNRIKISGNIYSDNRLGRMTNLLDHTFPDFGYGLQHFRNMLRGR